MKRIVICGAGIIGLCCALALRERGYEVTVIDRSGDPRDGDFAYGIAGVIAPSHFTPLASPAMILRGLRWMFDAASPLYIKPRLDWELFDWGVRVMAAANRGNAARVANVLCQLQFTSRELYEQLADRTSNAFALAKRGLLKLCHTQDGLRKETRIAAYAQSIGLAAEVLSPATAADLNPGAQMDICGAVHYPLDCHLDPERLILTLVALASSADVRFIWSTEASGWRTSVDRIEALCTSRESFEADEFVLAGGCWSPSIIRALGIRLPMQAGKGYSMTLREPREQPRLCSVLTEAGVAATPIGRTLRFAGTIEFSGLDSSLAARRIEAIAAAAARYFPAVRSEDFTGLTPWVGLRPFTPDGLPYVGRFSRFPNLCAATGHAMLGMSLGPVTGRLVAEIISGEAPSVPIAALSPDRYS